MPYFFEQRRLLRAEHDRASALSAALDGRHVIMKAGWTQWLHHRMCMQAHSMLLLATHEPRIAAREVCTLDHGSIAALSRVMIEAAILAFYISDPALTPEQWELRKNILWLNDATTRHRMLTGLGASQAPGEGREAIATLRGRVEASAEFQNLEDERKRKILSGSEVYLHGLRAAVRGLGWQVEEFNGVYAYLSAHTHSSPVSFIRMDEHGVDYRNPTRAQKSIAGVSLEWSWKNLKAVTDRLEEVFRNPAVDVQPEAT